MALKLDEKTIQNLPFTQKGQKYYFDTKQTGFGLCVGQKTKTFFIQRYRNNKPIRVKIGKHGDINCTVAREKAHEYAVEIQKGVNPNSLKREQRQQNHVTIQHLYDQYAQSLKAQGKHSSYEEYPKVLQRHLSDWLNKSAYNITREMIVQRHQNISTTAGPSIANRTCVILSGIYQHAISDKTPIENPVKVLSDRKLWNKSNQRTAYLKPKQFEPWLAAATLVLNETIRLFILFTLLNGLRKSEGLSLRWDTVDFDHQTFTISHTKNGKPHTLPMTQYTKLILEHLYQYRINDWVFPSTKSLTGHLVEPRRAVDHIKSQTHLDITLHDLRRSFTSVANNLGLSPYTIKHIINLSTANDVTAIYIPEDVESYREPLRQIQHQILIHANTDINQFL